METQIDVNRFNETLNQRVLDMEAMNHQLRRRLRLRTRVEAAFKKRGIRNGKLLKASFREQKDLRGRTHKVMSTQENERQIISHQLHDEIGQTLLGIHVRLLYLITTVRGDRANIETEIASAGRLVKESIRSINAFARRLDIMGTRGPIVRCVTELRASPVVA